MLIPAPKALLIDVLSDVLEMIAYGEEASLVADVLCRRAETFAPDAICSILQVDTGGRLRPMAAPSLPQSYSDALEGLLIGPEVGSCGTAAFKGEAVEVRDIEHDPLWSDFKELALPLGLRACWSSPIKARDGRVVGTFAFYYREARGPNDNEKQIVARCTHLCAILIESQEYRKRAHRLAFIDALTNLPNRAHFDLRLGEIVSLQCRFALLFADLDHLKIVNDTLGHGTGDELIRIVAKRLEAVASDIEVFRLGGDEFAFILRSCENEKEMAETAQSLINATNSPIEYSGMTLSPSITVGGVFRNNDATEKDTIYQNADFALYHAKEVNRGGFVPFLPGMRTTITHRLGTIAQLGEALSDRRVLPHYQPIVRLDSGEIVGLEALARIKARDDTVLSASEFQTALTDPRLAYQLTSQMLDQVAFDIRHWLDLGIPIQHVGFNVTTADLQKGDLERRITEAFSANGVPLKHLILEVNEAVFVNDDLVANEIKSLRARGMRVALDDFGTGYASLTHLLKFPVDIIKIDKSFVDQIASDKSSAVIVQSLLDIARQLDMRVVAEGVETKDQLDILMGMGCLLGQGYHFSPPTSAAMTVDLLRNFAQRPDVAEVLPKDTRSSKHRRSN